MDQRDHELSRFFLTLSDQTRLRLVRLMANGEVSVGFLAAELGESQPKVSRHLAFMREHNVVTTRRDGKHVFYGLDRDDPATKAIFDALLGIEATPMQPTAIDPQDITYPVRRIYDDSDELPIYLL